MGAPDLTMVDLPGITRVPIPGQPPDIEEQISEMIIHYITPNASIILNVISADVDFSTCESIKMSKAVDERGERTLAVVTKCDRAAEGLLEKVTMNAVNIRLGYVCVRNRIDNETNQEARKKEKALFESHPKLKKIDKSIVGIPVLATKLMHIQARSINKSLPTIVKKIDTMLSERQAELTNLPQHLCNPREADVAFVKVLNSMKECLNKIVIEGDFKQFQDDKQMHCTARLREMFESYYNDLRNTGSIAGKFLAKETEMLEEAKGVGLPNFLSRPVFLNLLQRLVDQITDRSLELVFKVWEFMENVIMQIIDFYCHCYPQLQSDARRVVHDLVRKMKEECEIHVNKLIQMEKFVDFTLSPFYMETYGRLLNSKTAFMDRLRNLVAEISIYGSGRGNTVVLDGVGEVDVSEILEVPTERVEEAYDMQMSVIAYWNVVTLRMGDGIPLYLQFICRNLVMNEFNYEILAQVGGPRFGAMEQLLQESPLVANKRRSLTDSIDLLKESKSTVGTIMDRIAKV